MGWAALDVCKRLEAAQLLDGRRLNGRGSRGRSEEARIAGREWAWARNCQLGKWEQRKKAYSASAGCRIKPMDRGGSCFDMHDVSSERERGSAVELEEKRPLALQVCKASAGRTGWSREAEWCCSNCRCDEAQMSLLCDRWALARAGDVGCGADGEQEHAETDRQKKDWGNCVGFGRERRGRATV